MAVPFHGATLTISGNSSTTFVDATAVRSGFSARALGPRRGTARPIRPARLHPATVAAAERDASRAEAEMARRAHTEAKQAAAIARAQVA
ncbi:hypothetical protein Sme01_60000 [Sphaerisporangium melleum]|uniref:Uncharacterized protein n=1 Tax=Sphaerisporangium melleum TaxID=321316 RepID=A0A917RAT8_9ACTN|nr:hypothetical protein [Sphaerisporangium melleum]GGK98821.1 hypothetical protein GCM10007964_46190 [Sphaerisporangium melleum]GII73524.1 hypothetical protein Sme01_60000 [Sphaerisporangium melleum]